MVLQDGVSQLQTAQIFGVKPELIKHHIKNEKLGKRTVAKIEEERNLKKQRRSQIQECVAEHVQKNYHIWNVQQIQAKLIKNTNLKVKPYEVRSVLRDDFNMRYRMLKRVAFQGNSERCLVMRMLYAKKMFSLLEQGKRIINIDETWLPHLDFRNKKWRQRGERNTMSIKSLSHRVNMIAAIDTDGRLYLSLTQFNTDSDVMLMFLSRLANVLSQEDMNWRENTLWLLDNAPYHRSGDVKQHLLKLGVNVILSGQYAYSAAPCETFFSYYKQEDQNPGRIKTSKTQVLLFNVNLLSTFRNTVKLVYERVQSMH